MSEDALLFQGIYSDINAIYETVRELDRMDFRSCFFNEREDVKRKGLIGKAFDILRKIVRDALKIVQNGINAVTDKIRYGCLSKKSKEKFDEMQRWLNEHPGAKHKKLTVKDWNKINAAYSDIEKNIVNMMGDDKVDANGLTLRANKMFDDLKNLIAKSSAIITVDMAMILARKSPQMADIVMKAFNTNKQLLKNVEEELGEKEASKLESRVKSLTKESTGRKLLATLMHKKQKSISDCLEEIREELGSTFKDLDSPMGVVKQAWIHRDGVRVTAKTAVKDKSVRKGVKNLGRVYKGFKNKSSDIEGFNLASEFFRPETGRGKNTNKSKRH